MSNGLMAISVLYIDDEEHLRDLAVAFLSKVTDIRCISVPSAQCGLQMLLSDKFDVIVTDYQMPEMDGLDLLKELSLRNIDIPVILFTGRGREEVAIEAFNLGATFYVQKGTPVKVQFQELIHKIRIAVDRDRTRKKLIESEQRFRSFFTHTLLGSAILNDSSQVIEVNDFLCNMLGMERNDLIDAHWPDILQSGMIPAHVHIPVFPIPKNEQYDTAFQRPDGTLIALRVATSPIYEGQLISGYSVLVSNVNAEWELKEQYDELVESWTVVAEHETSIRAVLNALSDSGLLLDKSGNILYYNPKAGDYLRLSSHSKPYNLCSLLPEHLRHNIRTGLLTARNTGLDQIIISDDNDRTYEWTIHPTMGTKTYEGQFVLFCRDITTIREITEELEATRERYRQFTEFLPQSLFEMDSHGQLIYLNPHALSVFQVTKEDVTQGIQYESFITHETLPFIRHRIAEAFDGRGGEPVEVKLIRRSGEIFPAFVQTIPIREKDVIIGIRGIIIDISDIRREERARRELEEKYRTLIDNAREIIIVSQDGLLKFINPLGAAITKYHAEELIGQPFSQFVHPDDQQLVYENYQKRLLDPDFRDDYLFRFIDRDGGIYWVKTHAIRIMWEGKPATLNMLSEITSLIHAQEALVESETRLSSILNFLPDPTFAINPDGNVIVWNQAIEVSLNVSADRILGSSKSEVACLLYGTRRPLLVDLLDNPDIASPDNYLIHRRERDLVIADVLITLPDGNFQYLWGKATHLFNPKGEVIGAIESIRDITDRKIIEENLVSANQKLNLFSSITRHDIRNQLSLIFLAIDSLFRLDVGEEIIHQVQRVDYSATKIQNFIDLAREYQEIGVTKPVWKPVMKTLLNVTSSMHCRVVFAEKEFPCDTVSVYSDPLLEKVFFNIVDNAIKYGSSNLIIHVQCYETESGLIIAIHDNGPGIPDDEKELIFSKGYGKGTGLGLFLVREILGTTGMQIRETGEFNNGARFEILVPRGKYTRG